MEIITYPDPILMRKAVPIEEIDNKICQIAQEMLDTMY
ncbi:hypothetical protein LCGC14_1819510, partial [marine sediment metagenome]